MTKNEFIEISEYLDQIGEHDLSDQYACRYAQNASMKKEAGLFSFIKDSLIGWTMKKSEVDACSKLIQAVYAELTKPTSAAPTILPPLVETAIKHQIIYMPSMYSAPGAHLPQRLDMEHRSVTGPGAGSMDVQSPTGPQDEVDRYYSGLSGKSISGMSLRDYLFNNKIIDKNDDIQPFSTTDFSDITKNAPKNLYKIMDKLNNKLISIISGGKLTIDKDFREIIERAIYNDDNTNRSGGRGRDPHGLDRLVSTTPTDPNAFLAKASAPKIMRYVTIINNHDINQQFGLTYYNLYRKNGGNTQDISNISWFMDNGYTVGACEQGRFIPTLTA